MHPTDNEQVFDSTVRELLEIGGIEYLELPPETLLEAISHGEGSEVSALNLIVQAHVAHLMNDVWALYEEDEWSIHLGEIKSEFGQGLEACHKLLIGLPPPQSQLAVQALGGWNHVIPDEYQLGIWDDFEDYFFFKASFSISTMIDRLTEFTLMTTEGKTQELLDLTRRFETETLTTWQQFLLPEIIQKVIDSNTDLEFHR